MAMTKVKALQAWCKAMADGYRDVEVRDMAASWKSGLAFCAIIHRFRPDLIDYDSLSKENVFDNNQLAFEVAERELSIPAFLEAADMVAIRVPDKLSVITYVSQYYNYFHDKPKLGGPGVKKPLTPGTPGTLKRTQDKGVTTPAGKHLTPVLGDKTPVRDRQESMGDKCSICHEKVYLLERQIDSGKLYHRACFRKSELSPTSKVFKRPSVLTVDEDKKETIQTKTRKIDSEPKVKTPEPNYWQRRAEAKAKEIKKEEPSASKTKYGNSNLNTVPVNSDNKMDLSEPSWKKTRETNFDVKKNGYKKDEKMDVTVPNLTSHTKDFTKENNSNEFQNRTKPISMASKFNELHERNLNRIADSNKIGEKDTQNMQVFEKISGDSKGRTGPSDVGNRVPVFPEKKLTDNRTVLNDTKRVTKVPDKKSSADIDLDSLLNLEENKAVLKRKQKKGKTGPVGSGGVSESGEPGLATSKPHEKTNLGQPKPKPRQLVQKEPEKMDTSESMLSSKDQTPKAAKRFQKHEDANTDSRFKKQTQERPKTPPRTRKDFSSREISLSKSFDESPESPPPLPGTSPPKSPASAAQNSPRSPRNFPRSPKSSPRASPSPSPRSPPPHRAGKVETQNLNIHQPPAKPPRASANIETTTRVPSPVDIQSDAHIARTKVKDMDAGQKAVVTVSGQKQKPEQGGKDVFGGLLKSLADVRSKHEVEVQKPKDLSAGETTGADMFTGHKPGAKPSHVVTHRHEIHTTTVVTKTVEKRGHGQQDHSGASRTTEIPSRPKATFVSDKAEMFSGANSNREAESQRPTAKPRHDVKLGGKHGPTEQIKNTRTSKDDSGVPEWKKRLEQKKAARPKSADLLEQKWEDGGKPEWQLEAEKRMAARKGGYVDPEKPKNIAYNKNQNQNQNGPVESNMEKFEKKPVRPSSPPHFKPKDDSKPQQDHNIHGLSKPNFLHDKDKVTVTSEGGKFERKRILPPAQGKQHEKPTPAGMKKIPVGIKFSFDLPDETEVSPKSPPARPAPSPQMGLGVHRHTPFRPPPPKKEGMRQKISPYDIQRQLRLIDSKLTTLELKGRSLEDSIRSANDDDEDDLMINWFELVNNKNDLVRQESDLIYLSREQELEDEQEQVEKQLQNLLFKPEDEKTEEDEKEIEFLIEKKLDLVSQRSNIVDSIDEDRLRYIEEDKDIQAMLEQKDIWGRNAKSKSKKKKKKGFSKDSSTVNVLKNRLK